MLERQLLTITQVSQRVGASVSSIKLWEKLGYIKKARRHTLRRCRVYTEADIAEIEQYINENYR